MKLRVIDVMPEDFDSILNHCLADVATGRETIDSCLRRYPSQASRLVALLSLAERVRAAPATPLAADKRRALEARLLKRAAQLRSKPVSRPAASRLPLWRRSFALAMASVIAVMLLLGSAVSASAASVPGDVLYPVKRATEQVRIAFTPDEQQADLHLEFARQRLQELSTLQERGEVSEELIAEISNETALVLDRIPTLPQDKQQIVLMSLTDFQDQQLKVLTVMAASVQGEAQAKVRNALADSTAKQQQAKSLLAGATPSATPVNPEPTVFHGNQAAPGKPTLKPTATDKPAPQATAKPTKMSPATPQKPTPRGEHTPPGQANQTTPERPTKEPKATKAPKN